MPTTEIAASTALDITWVRSQFPSLSQTVHGHPAAFLDGPGGTQVPQRVIDAIFDYLRRDNANTGGAYATSRHTDAMLAEARAAMGDFLNCSGDEIVFGPNMTTLTYAMSRAIGRELGPGDEIVVTRLDHDANVSPWLALEEKGVTVRWAEIHEEDCTLDLDDLASKINKKTRLVAIGYASNAVGTVNPVEKIVGMAHAAGALAYVDAVHYGPHGLIDVAALDCDFLVCSTYKFFGPHMGVLFGKREHLARLRPYKVRPLTDAVPNRWEWGTLNHECIAGITACVDYIADLGRRGHPEAATRREAIVGAFEAIHRYEHGLMERLMSGLAEMPAVKVYGVTDPACFAERCPTIALRVVNQNTEQTPLALASKLGERGFFTWDGNYYALNLTEHLDVEKSGGFLRIGLVHYNTMEEVERLLEALREIVEPGK
ncbi:MAG TPA: cysteine desulfurase-like protein [Candidatus Acidoferrum sp.]|nr:cysteine desulfurase-like protein [Candidatus Acidoferrum sp.]